MDSSWQLGRSQEEHRGANVVVAVEKKKARKGGSCPLRLVFRNHMQPLVLSGKEVGCLVRRDILHILLLACHIGEGGGSGANLHLLLKQKGRGEFMVYITEDSTRRMWGFKTPVMRLHNADGIPVVTEDPLKRSPAWIGGSTKCWKKV